MHTDSAFVILNPGMEGYCSSSESDVGKDEPRERPAKRRRTFSVAQIAHLNAMYEGGMNSVAKKYRPLLEQTATETGLEVEQVAVSK